MRNQLPDLLDATFARVLFESSLDGVVIVDGQGRTVEANAAALALPFTRIEPLLLERNTPDGELSAFHEQLDARGRASTEVRLASSCGRLRHVVIEGRALGTRRIFLLKDVTQLREAQGELEATRRLESLGHFTATLAHDVNNVLAPIACLGDLLAREVGEGTSASALVGDVTALARSGGELVRRVLGFARGEPTIPKPVDLTAHIRGMRQLLESLLGGGVALDLSLEQAPAEVIVDPVIFEHVLLNLVANARDAIFERPSGGSRGIITVRTANVLLGFTESEMPLSLTRGRYVMITVTDDGAGMPPEVCARALESFFTTKDARHGLGVGLSNARRFAIAGGGSISVRSEENVGTTVTIHLPQAD
ncbi:MAG: ATP-binding protein [Polyangiales bacterium]